ncbi:interleukin-26 [Bufo gargarizans]|uniref:interleukin-26 n=1 Tax=Bufo gargarizans TaxID=30331 RepID=UPI001CF20C89|nr:interleukin-26 [Bufo gargarizans]
MKISCIYKQALCLMSLLVLTCDSKGPMKRICSIARISKENEKLLNKTAEFQKLFPDDITNIELLTEELKNEFMANCSTRLHLLSFYTNVLLADMVLPETQKYGIDEAFLQIEHMLKLCWSINCQVTKSTEESEEMKEFRNKISKITFKEKLHKAISEIDTLLTWINSFIKDIKRKGK